MGNTHRFDLLVVITPKDFERLIGLYSRLIDSFPYGKVLFVSAPEISALIDNSSLKGKAEALDENSLISFDDVHACIKEKMKNILAGRELPRGITGWYYQQFLKMQYAFTCQDEYYMVWDGDTIPCKEISMFQKESGKPYLDMKHEYHAEYFETMGKILPGFGKVIERSFISEHMLFRTDIMRSLIQDIEKNDAIEGTKFWEKIINAIPEEKIQDSSFSEFETYGTYVALRFQNVYKLREWHSFRQGGNFFSIDTICDRDFTWLAQDFDAISFEKGHEVREDNANLFDNPYYQEKLTPKQMLQAAQMEYKEGYKEVWTDDPNAARANYVSGGFSMSADVIPEDRLKYLDKDTYKIYEKLGDDLKDKNINQAFLCYENAEYLCEDTSEKERITGKKNGLKESGNVAVNKAAFIILSYNNTYYLQRCIESIYTNCNPDAYLLVVFENGSKDGTSEWLAQWGNDHDEALIILNEENLGFSVGNNAACEYLPEGYDVFYLNNDTRVPANALFWLRMALYSSEEIGAVGAVQNYSEGDQLLDVRFDAPEQYVEFGASNNVPMDNPLEEQSKLCGFAMFLKREAYDKVGGFDPAFTPGFLEDDDLSLRIREKGYKLMVCHNAYMYHAGSQSFIKRNDLRELFAQHREYLVDKWGFDSSKYAVLSVNELKYINEIEKKGYKRDDRFSIVHVGCGCGNMLGRIHFMYPNADLYGVEENDDARRFTISCVKVFKSVSELPMKLEEFDLVAQYLG
jgi:GT2 family glycosyltransferase